MASMQVVEDEFYAYDGELAECKGGGSSGKTDYPAYMKYTHGNWMIGTSVTDGTGTGDSMTYSVVDLMNTAMGGSSPYSGFTTASPETTFFGTGGASTDYTAPFDLLQLLYSFNPETAYDGYLTDDTAEIDAMIAAHSAAMEDEVLTNTLPRFKASMNTSSATEGSAFVVGQALIWNGKQKKVDEFAAKARYDRLSQGADLALRRVAMKAEFLRTAAHMATDMTRLYLAARHEKDASTLEAAEKDALWDLSIYQYGTQVMASISGSATSHGTKSSSGGAALSGALAGAATGAMAFPANPAMGAAGGAAIGLAASFM